MRCGGRWRGNGGGEGEAADLDTPALVRDTLAPYGFFQLLNV